MTRDELERKLATIGIHQNSYSLDGIRHSDCVCVVAENGKWFVYYVERDKPRELGAFSAVEDAFEFVYTTFCKWLGVDLP
ncbi:hypothetical protein [Cupriavidus laharis]|uniref:hypothetical protein n=1 Tax=Cupriavidus laharis TaxID=151654 RepID=UPI001CC6E462|nr:hypothetical protein [Cupriavidus laharis]